MTRSDARNGGANLIVVSGPSGVGKSTVVRAVLERMADVAFSVSATTRAPRNGETEGVHYHFLTRAEFQKRVAEHRFLEHAEVFGQLYGTPAEELAKTEGGQKALLLEIDVQGGIQVRRRCPEALLILLVPPTLEALKDRLARRGTEGPEAVARRFALAERELKMARDSGAYDVEVVNDDLEIAIQRVQDLIRDHRRSRDDRRSQE